jgi:hypothetical protein
MTKIIFIGGIFLIFLAGCGQSVTPQPLDPTVSLPTEIVQQETPVMNEVPIPTPPDPFLESLVTQVKSDLAERLAIAPEQIELVDAASVTWPDRSLGCPQPGMVYTQVQVDGFLIRLRVKDQIYEYHGGGGRAPFLCE